MSAFIIGNGPSRLNTNLPGLQEKGMIYGCNALYRDFIPDYLVSIDLNMIEEIMQSKVDKLTKLYIPDSYETHSLINMYRATAYFLPHPLENQSAGIAAATLAVHHGHRNVYLLGFDFNQENIYAGTQNYAMSNLDIQRQIDSLGELVDRYRKVTFIKTTHE